MPEISEAELERYRRIERWVTDHANGRDLECTLSEALGPVYEPLVNGKEIVDIMGTVGTTIPLRKLGALYLRKAADRLEEYNWHRTVQLAQNSTDAARMGRRRREALKRKAPIGSQR